MPYGGNMSIIDKVKDLVKVHRELHGKDGVVDYAIADDFLRKNKGLGLTKDEVIKLVKEVLEVGHV